MSVYSGAQAVQLVAVPEQVLHDLSQALQALFLMKNPIGHSVVQEVSTKAKSPLHLLQLSGPGPSQMVQEESHYLQVESDSSP